MTATRLRAAVAAGLLLGAVTVTAAAAPASAYCDPKYYPACANDCTMYWYNHPEEALENPLAVIEPRICPA